MEHTTYVLTEEEFTALRDFFTLVTTAVSDEDLVEALKQELVLKKMLQEISDRAQPETR
jgi:hypothetical protein